MIQQITNSYGGTQILGEDLAQKLSGGDVVLLYGDLGAGKTTFMQGLSKGLGITHRIISPTFIIVRKYDITNNQYPISNIKALYHIDLYRTETDADLEGIGLSEILSDKEAIVAIEWPEKMHNLPKKRWEVHLKWLSENERNISIKYLK